jgi:DNA invertase Pin-like site-specific DNA recombinase
MQKKTQMNVSLYARDAVGGKSGSVDAQLDRLTTLVEDRQDEGWTIKEKLVDRGRSGSHADRPAYQKLLRLVRSGKIDLVAVTRIDRLSRNMRDIARLLGELDRGGVRLVSLGGRIDVTSALRLLAEAKNRRRN